MGLQKRQESLKDGFVVQHRGGDYVFAPSYIDRNDKKMARILTGLGDGCDSCLAPRSTWSDVEAIEDGFVMDRSYQQIQETWKNLPRDSNGELIKATGDYATRQGLC